MGKKYYSNDFITEFRDYLDITPIKSSKKSRLPKIIIGIICALIIIGIILYIINNNKIEEEDLE